MEKVLITGAAGKIADVLCDLPYQLVFTDINEPDRDSPIWNHYFEQGDLNDSSFLKKLLKNKQVLIHLGGSSSPDSSWEDVVRNNISGTRNIFHAAKNSKVDKIIFASSNRVYGMYEEENSEYFYSSQEKESKITEEDEPRPNSYYGVSKIFGESLGRYYSEVYDIDFISLRIGSVLSEKYDHPYGYAQILVDEDKVEINDPEYNRQVGRLKGTWLARRDFCHIVDCCIKTKCNYGIFNAISDNSRAWLSIARAKEILNYQPKENAENWTKDKL